MGIALKLKIVGKKIARLDDVIDLTLKRLSYNRGSDDSGNRKYLGVLTRRRRCGDSRSTRYPRCYGRRAGALRSLAPGNCTLFAEWESLIKANSPNECKL